MHILETFWWLSPTKTDGIEQNETLSQDNIKFALILYENATIPHPLLLQNEELSWSMELLNKK